MSMHLPLITLLRGDTAALGVELRKPVTLKLLLPYIVAIVIGCGIYGFAIGLWRAPLLGVFVAVKMPLLVFFTLLVNGLINGLFAQILGSGLSFRQTLMACLMCFAIFGLMVGSLSPIVIGMVLDSPSPDSPDSEASYRMILLTHTAVIAAAGIVSNFKLLRLLQAFAGDAAVGKRTFIAWLAGNLFVGAQLSYVLRPFFGNPGLKVEFLRPNPFQGNFYEAVWFTLCGAVGAQFLTFFTVLLMIFAPFLLLFELLRNRRRQKPGTIRQ
ncbi:MAG: hypothetical protein JWO89_880 [Verrucomicrobiaceae bacterium]|nr:hypothetical protein [Verrucomicrobiaceae bacterium]